MSGYLYFDRTGDEAVDAILGAIHKAGNRQHNTQFWPRSEDDGYFGESCIEMIQRVVEAEVAKLRHAQEEDG